MLVALAVGILAPGFPAMFPGPGNVAEATVPAGSADSTWDADPAVPSPAEFLGYPPGKQFTPHARIVAYLRELAAASERVAIDQYGTTYENRPLVLLTISDPENLKRRASLQEAYAQLADPRVTSSEGAARDRSRDLPLAVWLSFDIHGNEASTAEAAMAVAYRLAADRSPEALARLRSVVVLLDPCLNPDGHDRYVNWLRGVTGSAPDPLLPAREHHEPWPGGRFNHYLFDLNRDWAWLTQRETRARVRAYLAWHPQVHVDFHEMGAQDTYFFFPPERPVHPQLPGQVMKWAEIFGRANAAAFDARGWRYYTGESFDLYYPGYGDSWPTFHGAVGMTYEQAGNAAAGLALQRDDGDTLTLGERIEHHAVAALTTVATAAANREARLLDFHRFFARTHGRPPGAYLFPPGDDPPRTAELVDLLLTHGAEVYRARTALRPRGLHAYDGTPVSTGVPAGTYVVPLDQPLHRFLHAVLDPETALPDTFFYDISAWSLPLAFGVDAYRTDAPVTGPLDRLDAPPRTEGKVTHPDARYAFLIPWERNGAARGAAWLQQHGVRIYFSTRAFTLDGKRFGPGTLVIFRSGNPPDLTALVTEAAARCAVDILGVETGLTETGPDLGSFRMRLLKPPRVAVVAGPPASPTSVGACWFLLDRAYGIPHSLIRPQEITPSALQHYTVLVLPDDGAGGRAYARSLDSTRVEVLRTWIRQGGVFVGLGGGAFFADADMAGLSSVKKAPPPDKEETQAASEETQEARDKQRRLETSGEREQRRRRESLPGTIFRIKVDPLHPLGFGYEGEARVLKITNRALELGPPGTNVAWFPSAPKVSGYASRRSESHLAERPFLLDEPVGRGHVVLYVEDPNFRLFWYGLNRLFLNSLFFLAR